MYNLNEFYQLTIFCCASLKVTDDDDGDWDEQRDVQVWLHDDCNLNSDPEQRQGASLLYVAMDSEFATEGEIKSEIALELDPLSTHKSGAILARYMSMYTWFI